MDEEEYQRLVSGTVGGMGAAGAIGVPIHKKYWDNPNFPEPGDIIEGMPPAFNIIDDNYYRVDDQGNPVEGLLDWYKHGVSGGDWRLREYEDMTPFQRWSYNQGYRFAQDPMAEMIDWTVPFLTFLQDKIPGLGNLIPDLSTAEDYKYDPEVEEIEIPEYTPYDPGEFEYGHWTEGLGEPNPEIGGGYGVYGDPALDYFNLQRDLVDKGLYPEYTGPEDTSNEATKAWNEYFDASIPDIHAEEERKWQLEYDAAKEAFDRRNEEEERRHREEYDKMVEDLMDTSFSTEGVGVPTLPPMDTDFSMGDLEQGAFEQIRDMINDYFSEDAQTPAELMPLPEWLSVPSASTDPLNLDNALSWNNRVSPKVLNVEPSAQDIMDWNPGLFTPTNEFNTTIPNPALENMYNDPGAANKALDFVIPPLS